MKTFNATDLNKEPAKIFRHVDKEGSAKINHDRYPDIIFILEARDRRKQEAIDGNWPRSGHPSNGASIDGCQHSTEEVLDEAGDSSACSRCGEIIVRFDLSPYEVGKPLVFASVEQLNQVVNKRLEK